MPLVAAYIRVPVKKNPRVPRPVALDDENPMNGIMEEVDLLQFPRIVPGI